MWGRGNGVEVSWRAGKESGGKYPWGRMGEFKKVGLQRGWGAVIEPRKKTIEVNNAKKIGASVFGGGPQKGQLGLSLTGVNWKKTVTLRQPSGKEGFNFKGSGGGEEAGEKKRPGGDAELVGESGKNPRTIKQTWGRIPDHLRRKKAEKINIGYVRGSQGHQGYGHRI